MKVLSLLVAAVVLATISALFFVGTASAGSIVHARFCAEPPHCASPSPYDPCVKAKFPTNTCIPRFGLQQNRHVILTCNSKQEICANVTQFSDKLCENDASQIDTVCATCNNLAPGGLKLDCSQLPFNVWTHTNCSSPETCSGCTISNLPIRKCSYLADLPYVNIHGGYYCNSVTVQEFSDPSCSTPKKQYSLPNGKCSFGEQLTCA